MKLHGIVALVLKGLLLAVLGCLLLSMVPESVSWFLHTEFDLDRESNIPTWLSAMLLFTGAFSGALIALKAQHDKQPTLVRFWMIFAAVFAFLSLDEISQFHEIFSIRLKSKNPWIWVVVYAPFAAGYFITLVRYLVLSSRESFSAKILMILGLCLFAGGGFGVELLGHLGRMTGVIDPALTWPLILLEEGLELLGVTFFAVGCLQALSEWWPISD